MRLEPAEFNLLWTRLGLPATPLELNVPAQGMTLTEAARISAHATDTLRDRGLLTGDEPAPRVAGLLTLLATPEARLDLRWARGGDVPELRGLVAARGKNCVRALWDGSTVDLRSVKHDMAVEELTSALGEWHAGGARSVTAPADVVRRASRDSGGDGDRFQRTLVAGGLSRDDARAWRDFVSVPGLRAGQIGASAFDRWGKQTRVPWVIHVLDTERGRYATYERRGHRTVISADRGRLVTVTRELYADALRVARKR